MCSYLTGAGAQAAPSRPRPPPLRSWKSQAREWKFSRYAGMSTPPAPKAFGAAWNRGGHRGFFARHFPRSMSLVIPGEDGF